MRTLTACVLSLAIAVPAAAQTLSPPRFPDGPEQDECRAALAVALDRGPAAELNVYPVLWVDAQDPRWPLVNCSLVFAAAGLPRYMEPTVADAQRNLSEGRKTLSISRPDFTGPDTATVTVDSTVGVWFRSRTIYTVRRDGEDWRVTDRKIQRTSGLGVGV